MLWISQIDRKRFPPEWNMSQERAFMEQIMNQRFNFFLVFFSVICAGALNSKSHQHFFVLVLGAVLSFLLAWTIFRAHCKLDWILRFLSSDKSHPYTIVNDAHSKRWSARGLIGWFIPIVCTLVLILGACFAYMGWLPDSQAEHESKRWPQGVGQETRRSK
jgi:hypothetical protein